MNWVLEPFFEEDYDCKCELAKNATWTWPEFIPLVKVLRIKSNLFVVEMPPKILSLQKLQHELAKNATQEFDEAVL